MKSTKNNHCQRYNVVRYFSFFCRMEQKKEKKTLNGRKLPVKYKDWRSYCRPLFLLITLISLYKNIFRSSCCWTEKKLALSRKRSWFRWWHSPSWLVKFYIIMSYTFQQLQCVFRVQQKTHWKHLFPKKTKFPSNNF